jgi:hypothetical protein
VRAANRTIDHMQATDSRFVPRNQLYRASDQTNHINKVISVDLDE